MNRLVRLPADRGPVLNAAIWLRDNLDIPANETISDAFGKHFNCRIVREPIPDSFYDKIYAVFDSEQDAAWFIIKWS